MRREAKFQTKFNEWLKDHDFPTAAFELKFTKTDSLPFSRVEEHQINALTAAKHRQLIYKIPDDTRSYRPFDSFCLNNCPAFVVIRYPQGFVGIDIDDFKKETAVSPRRSLTYSRALVLGSFSGSI